MINKDNMIGLIAGLIIGNRGLPVVWHMFYIMVFAIMCCVAVWL